MDADDMIAELGLSPHPEGGHYIETWRARTDAEGRASATAIQFLLAAGERSHWHRVDADELWIHNAGTALDLSIVVGDRVETTRLGADVTAGDRSQALVPAGCWQSAVPCGPWSLVSCVVVPGFEFDGFELAPPDWSPDDD